MKTRMEELVKILNNASKAYYQGEHEIMSNYEYDRLYDELLLLEDRLGIVLPDSPTQKVGYEVVSSLNKMEHNVPALSLDKTKDRAVLTSWLGDKTGVLSWKMDGLTIVATYDDGKLTSAVTRGNGYIGENVTHNAKYFEGLPEAIADRRHIEIRGEAVIEYDAFNRINDLLPAGEKYKNPRNLASGSVRQMDSKSAAARKIKFFAFTLVNASELGIEVICNAYALMLSLGFNVVEYRLVTASDLNLSIATLQARIKKNAFPSDGLVLTFNDIAYGESLGTTGKYPRNAIAFKWMDETAETVLRDVEWSPSRTGLINPVAVFDPVELEGTTVNRASLHNISIIRKLGIGIGDRITVYKANMIIPQVAEDLDKSKNLPLPGKCPVCGSPTEVYFGTDGSESLFCTNPDCRAKLVGRLEHFVSRDCMNIDGLSTETLEKLIAAGYLNEVTDLYNLKAHKAEIAEMPGFGQKSVDKLIENIESSRNTTFRRLFASLGIPNAGRDVAKLLDKVFSCSPSHGKLSWLALYTQDGKYRLEQVDGIGPIIADNIRKWFASHRGLFQGLINELTVTDDLTGESQGKALDGKTFVITGSLEQFKNRDQLTSLIETNGGKVAGSVSSKTSYLINNDSTSSSGKNKKAKELGIPVITEAGFIELLNNLS